MLRIKSIKAQAGVLGQLTTTVNMKGFYERQSNTNQ